MGRRGPKPEAATVRQAKAAMRSKREPRPKKPPASVAKEAAAVGPNPPSWLKPEGRKIWDQLAPTLQAAKLLGLADVPAFGRYCQNFATWLQLRAELDRDGYAYDAESYAGATNEEGAKRTVLRRADPRFTIADRLERQLLAAEDRFGMNPSERQRIMASRMNTGATGDLFDTGRQADDPASKATPAAAPMDSPVGLLNVH